MLGDLATQAKGDYNALGELLRLGRTTVLLAELRQYDNLL